MSSFAPNAGQARAIDAPLGKPLRVLAGAGTGKTEVVTRRYLRLLQAPDNLLPENILVLTFSEKAAAEMRARIFGAVAAAGLGRERLDLAGAPISTFHSFGARLLRENSLLAGVEPGLPLLAEVDVQALREAIREQFLAGGYREALGELDPLAQADYDWNSDGPFTMAWAVVDQLRNQAASLRPGAGGQPLLGRLVAWLARRYEAELAGTGRLDFDRLILDAAALLEREPWLRAGLRQRYRAILVDEYQDTNFAQARLLRSLAADALANVTVVGDPRQAIYVWREARVENIAGFPWTVDAPLVENRRSLRPILAVANHAIAGYALGEVAEFAVEDQLSPSPEHEQFEGVVVSLQAAPSRADEARAVVEWVRQAQREGYAYRDIALLVRARTYLPEYVAALEAAGIPLEISAGDDFYSRPEILDAIHLLRVCLDPADDLSLVRVLISPCVGLSQAEVAALRGQGRAGRRSIWRALQAPGDPAVAAAEERVQRFLAFWASAQAQRWSRRPAAFLGWALQASGLSGAASPAAGRALRKLLAVAHAWENDHPRLGPADLAEALQRLLEGDPRAKAPELGGQADAMPVMTAHASKGLEFPVVIAADCREKVHPRRRLAPFHEPAAGLVNPADDEANPHFQERVRRARNEARCVWYVTLTRARRRLIITATDDAQRVDGRYASEETLFEELWNRLARAPVEGVELVEALAG